MRITARDLRDEPILVDRAIRGRYAFDDRFHGELKATAEAALETHPGLAGMQEPTRHTARGASLSVPVYRYYYTHVPPTEAGLYLGCFHGSELAYLFGNLDAAKGYGPGDTVFSNQIMALWTNFAKTGTPYATGLPAWSEFSVGQENAFHLKGPDDFELTEDGKAQEVVGG